MKFQQGFLVRFIDFVGAWLPIKIPPWAACSFSLGSPSLRTPKPLSDSYYPIISLYFGDFFVWLKTGWQPFLGEKYVEEKEIPLTPMVILAPVTMHAGPSAQPLIDVSRSFLACLSAESPSNISPNFSEVISEAVELLEIFEISRFSSQNRVNWGGRGVSEIFFWIEIFQFLLLGSPCKNL